MTATTRLLAALSCVLLMALGTQAQTRYPQPQSRTEVGDWVVECFAPNDLGQSCQIYQRVLVNNGSAIAMVATLAYGPPDDTLSIQVALPLGIDVSQGATIAIDKTAPFDVGISRCTQQGCLIEGVVAPALESALRTGGTASITVIIPSQGNFSIPLSLSGFSAALDRIAPPPPAAAEKPEDSAANAGPETETDPETPKRDNTLRPVTGSE